LLKIYSCFYFWTAFLKNWYNCFDKWLLLWQKNNRYFYFKIIYFI